MSNLNDIISDTLDRGLSRYCPHCQNGIDWRDYNPELAGKIAVKVESYFRTELQKILDNYEQTIKIIKGER